MIHGLGLNTPKESFHNGGNDANYTLRALLLLIVKMGKDLEDKSSLNVLDAVARSPLPEGSYQKEQAWDWRDDDETDAPLLGACFEP